MNIKYLGTGSGLGLPVNGCECPACTAARKSGGRNIRTPASVLIDDGLLVDISPGFPARCETLGIGCGSIWGVLITHQHDPHADIEELIGLIKMRPESSPPLSVLGSAEVEKKLYDGFQERGFSYDSVEFNRLTAFKTKTAGPYDITPLRPRHVSGAFIYIIENDGKRMLYGNDSGYFPEETWDYLFDMPFDFVSLDCNNLINADAAYHMTIEDNSTIRKRLFQQGCTKKTSRFAATHFSHKAGLTHQEINDLLRLLGLITAYDGMEINV